jgi:dTDP-glucose 4,6-dehydratase
MPEGVTHVIHCASAGSGAETRDDPAGVVRMIVDGTERVVRECERVGVSRLLLLSSGSLYTRTDPITHAKREAEQIAFASTVPTVSARVFSLIGPRLGPQFAVSQFFADALAGRPIRVERPATLRSYLYAADLTAWLYHLLVHGEAGQCVPVGHPSPVTLGTLALLIASETQGRTEMQPHPAALSLVPESVDPPFLLTPLHEAIAKTLAWHRRPIQRAV